LGPDSTVWWWMVFIWGWPNCTCLKFSC
jgi:hypothetical protein